MTTKSAVAFTAFSLLVSGCTPPSQENASTPSAAVSINESPEQLLRRNGDRIKALKQAPGVTFYTAHWEQENPATVAIEHGKYSIMVPHALGMQGVEEPRSPAEGLVQFDIFAGITGPDLIGHDEARQKLFGILQNIRNAGWTPFIDRDDPRLRGKARLDYVMQQSSASSLDADYEPALEQWMLLEDLSKWTFYADHAYLTVAFKRESSLPDANKPGSYLLTYTIMSENQHFRAYVSPANRDNWKRLLPAVLKDLQKQRQQSESGLRANGTRIDDAYVDPPGPSP